MSPTKKARKEINLAQVIATFIPNFLLPVKYHIKDFNITPPSRGIIGIRLNTVYIDYDGVIVISRKKIFYKMLGF